MKCCDYSQNERGFSCIFMYFLCAASFSDELYILNVYLSSSGAHIYVCAEGLCCCHNCSWVNPLHPPMFGTEEPRAPHTIPCDNIHIIHHLLLIKYSDWLPIRTSITHIWSCRGHICPCPPLYLSSVSMKLINSFSSINYSISIHSHYSPSRIVFDKQKSIESICVIFLILSVNRRKLALWQLKNCDGLAHQICL